MSTLDWSGRVFNELLNRISDSEPSRLLIVTGRSGSGKTIWCSELAHQAREIGISIAGLVSPALFQHGQKIGIDLFDLVTGERRRLANRRPNMPDNFTGRTWELDIETLGWGNEVLSQIDSCQLLVLDELGPLELVENQGLTQGIDLLDARKFALSCVAVRPSLLSNAIARWPWATVLNGDGVLA
jgi:nucleoside-triphosphatase THEP1